MDKLTNYYNDLTYILYDIKRDIVLNGDYAQHTKDMCGIIITEIIKITNDLFNNHKGD